MSLSTFLARPDVREKFRQEFPMPRIGAKKELLAQPQSNRYSLVGTAFDYLLRFYLQRLNPKVVHRRWVAEAGLWKLANSVPLVYNIDAGRLSAEDRRVKAGRKAFDKARTVYAEYIESGKVTGPLLRGAIYLAQLDVVFRSGWVDENLGIAQNEDVQDLRNLLSLVNPDDFRAKRLCLLNPTFGDASRLVGGADADLVIDSMLVDVKTTKNFVLKRNDFNQLIGYMVLHDLNGFDGIKSKRRISKLSIYFSRHAHLETFDVRSIVNPDTYPSFVRWFSTAAETTQPGERRRSAA